MVTSSIASGCAAHKTPANPFNGKRYLKIAETAKFLGLSQPTVRQMVDTGELGNHLTIGGHRRIETASVLSWAYGEGWNSVDDDAGKKIIGYIRVSSRAQAVVEKSKRDTHQSSLEHQRDRIRAYASEHYQTDDFEIYEDVGSGMNLNREGLNNLLAKVMNNEYRGAVLLVSDFSRLARFSYDLIKRICDFGGVTIQFTMDEREAKTENETLIDDILGIMTHFTAKASGAKSAKILTIHVDPETMKRGWEIYQTQKSYRATVQILEQDGFRDSRGNPYKVGTIRRALIENQDSLQELFGGSTTETSFEQFVHKHIRRGTKTDCVRVRDVMARYHRWCNENGQQQPMTKVAIGALTKKKLGWAFKIVRGKMFYLGITLDG